MSLRFRSLTTRAAVIVTAGALALTGAVIASWRAPRLPPKM